MSLPITIFNINPPTNNLVGGFVLLFNVLVVVFYLTNNKNYDKYV